ncbi:MAG: hypothetical protein WBC69_07290, partial [Geitlerinemataceae cyanobacterium]
QGCFIVVENEDFVGGSAKSAYPATDEIMGVPEIGATTLGIPGRLRFAPTENETALPPSPTIKLSPQTLPR